MLLRPLLSRASIIVGRKASNLTQRECSASTVRPASLWSNLSLASPHTRRCCFAASDTTNAGVEVIVMSSQTDETSSCTNDEDVPYGLRATQTFATDDLVMQATTTQITATPNKHSIQIYWNQHVHVPIPVRFVNHSCGDGNVGIVISRQEDDSTPVIQLSWYALKDIGVYEDILWDYESTEFSLQSPFECACQSTDCRGTIRGFQHNHHRVQNVQSKFIATYLQEWYTSHVQKQPEQE